MKNKVQDANYVTLFAYKAFAINDEILTVNFRAKIPPFSRNLMEILGSKANLRELKRYAQT